MGKMNEISRLMNEVFELSSHLYFLSNEIAEEIDDTPIPPSVQAEFKSKLAESLNSVLFLFSFIVNLEGKEDEEDEEDFEGLK